jgi:PAS domain S-box-containing protein
MTLADPGPDLLDAVSDLIARWAPDGRIVYTNRAWRATLGAGSDAGPVTDRVDPAARAALAPLLAQALAGAWLPDVATTLRAADGRAVAVRGALGPAPGGAQAVWRDVTAEQASAARLRAGAHARRQMFDTAPAVRLLIDPGAGRIVDANPAAYAYYGYPPAALRNAPLGAIHAREPAELAPEIARALAAGRHAFRTQHRLASGAVREVEVVAGPAALGGRPLLDALVFDLTERLGAEAALRAAAEQGQALFTLSFDAMLLADATGRVRAANPAACALFGRGEAALCALAASDLADPTDERRAAAWAALGQAGQFRGELRFRRADGSVFPAEVAALRAPAADGAAVSIALRDISARVEAAAAMQRARAVAEEAIRTKSQFVANMSHELRTPLNAIIGYSELMQEAAEANGDDETAHDLDRIRVASHHLLGLINDVLDLSRLEAGQAPLDVKTFSVEMLALQAAQVTRALLPRGARLETRIAPDAGMMRSDPGKLRQALLHLLNNAAKFTPQGLVTLEASRAAETDGDWVTISVRDTGIGMTPAQVSGLFQEFWHADPSHATRYGGAGLGLALSRGLVRLIGGDITVSSAPGVGSTFTIRAPAEAPEAPGA